MTFKGPHSAETRKRIAKKMKLYAKEHPNYNHIEELLQKHRIIPVLYPSESLVYILGVLVGDGYVTVSKDNNHYYVCLQSISKNFVSSFKRALEDIGLHPCKIYRDSRGIYHAVAVSKNFVKWYKNLSLAEFKRITDSYQIAFVRGVYESEGSLFFNRQHRKFDITIANSNFETLKMVSNSLSSRGIRNTIYKRGRTVNDLQMYNLRIYQAEVQRFLYIVKPCIKFLSNSAIVKDYA